MKRALLLIFSLVFFGCGGGGGGTNANGPGASPGEKSLFSLWTDPNTGFFIDLTGGTFGVPIPITFIFSGGGQCDCKFKVTGSEQSGSYMISDCFYSGGGNGNPGCNLLNQAGTYTKSGNTLTACAAGGDCTTYH